MGFGVVACCMAVGGKASLQQEGPTYGSPELVQLLLGIAPKSLLILSCLRFPD